MTTLLHTTLETVNRTPPTPPEKYIWNIFHLMMIMHTWIHRQVCQNSDSICSLSHRLSDTDRVVTHQLHWWLQHTLSSLQDIKQDTPVLQTDLQPMEKWSFRVSLSMLGTPNIPNYYPSKKMGYHAISFFLFRPSHNSYDLIFNSD